MKKIVIVLCFLLPAFLPGVTAQSWTEQSSGTVQNLSDIFFLNPDTGYACGWTGTVLKTTNGGTTWSALSTGTTDGLACIQFTDSQTGYASGGFIGGAAMNCRLIKTLDGGATWSDIPVEPTHCGGGMWFHNATTGLYAHANTLYGASVISRTTDGGATWTEVYAGSGWISFFDFPDATHGYATVNNGTVLKTSDGGVTWTEHPLPGSLWGSGVAFTDSQTGLIGGGPPDITVSMYKTADGGTTWEPVTAPDMIFTIDFADVATAYAISVNTSGAGKLVKSIDHGTSWVNETTPKENLRGIFFLNANLGYAVGDAGVILKYLNASGISDEPDPNQRFTLYPNPVTGTLSIKTTRQPQPSGTISIFTTTGTLMQTTNLTTNPQSIDLTNLPQGLYFIELKTPGHTETHKITKN